MISTLRAVNESTLAAIREEKQVRKTGEMFLLFSLGSQFDHLIKQAMEKLGVFCLVADPSRITAKDVTAVHPKGVILSGGPASVHSEPPAFDRKIFDLGIPVLGICLGFQLWAEHVGADVTPASKREFGVHVASATSQKGGCPLFVNCPSEMHVLESHGDQVQRNDRMAVLYETKNAPVAAAQENHLYGVQFHPECTETDYGARIFENFCFMVCGAKDRFPAGDIAEQKIDELFAQIEGKRVLLALSAGSDSSTVAYLLKQAAKRKTQIRGVYIRGIDRPDDEAHVRRFFGNERWLSLVVVDATKEFLAALKRKTTMHSKRVAVRKVYKAILEREAKKFGASFIAQGTLYTDISESGGGYHTGARKARIKLHHNTNLRFSLPEIVPLADCVKDSGRNIGRAIGVPEMLLTRHPFPGPGLVVRIEGEVTAKKLSNARAIDGIYVEELRKWKLYDTVWQAGAVITRSATTFTKGDDAGTGPVIALWAVWSVNGFTARFAKLPWDFIERVSRRITNEVRGAGSVVYRTSDKPPSTIEWG